MLFLLAAAFALQAGEFSTPDIMRMRTRRADMRARVDTLQHEVDSLHKVVQMIRSDPATQERIAREEFGMVRGDKEILYRFAPSRDSSEASR